MGPVRRGNQAFEHAQHDVYGEVILATTQAFFDRRLLRPANEDMFRRLEPLGEQAVRLYDQPDAGLWELRTKAQIHTMSSARLNRRAFGHDHVERHVLTSSADRGHDRLGLVD